MARDRDRDKDRQRDLFGNPPPKPPPELPRGRPPQEARPAPADEQRSSPRDDAPAQPSAPESAGSIEHPLSIRDLARRIRLRLEGSFAGRVFVAAELSNVKTHHGSGHIYFTLADSSAALRCVMWASDAQRLEFPPRDGLQVIARGKLSFYEPRGDCQLYVDALIPQGRGAAQLAFEALRKRLGAEGLLDSDRKRPLPFLPRAVGIVTSLHGAALRDMLTVMQRRCPVPVVVSPCSVQGDQASWEIADAIRLLCRYAERGGVIDVILLGRGGGSYEDLAAFNEERVARAIAASTIPVVSAVGHETDTTIADLVADRRALTPSEGAELVVPDRRDLLASLRRLQSRLTTAANRPLRDAATRLANAERRLRATRPERRLHDIATRIDALAEAIADAMHAGLDRRRHQLDGLARGLRAHDPAARLRAATARLDALGARLASAVRASLAGEQQRLATIAGRLDALSPLRVLERGYSVTLNAGGHAVIDATTLAPGDELRTRLHRGQITSRVESIEPPTSDAS